MSLLQYVFEQKRVRDNSLQNNQNSNNEDNEDNPNKNIKKSCTNNNKTFKLKWLTEFSWLHYNEDQKKIKSAIREYTNTEDYNDVEKLEISRIQMESLRKEFTFSDINTKHIIAISNTSKEIIWNKLYNVVAFGVMIDENSMIQATIYSIQKEYILVDQNYRFGQNFQIFIDETNQFENSLVTYLDNNIFFIEQDCNEFIMDVYNYSTNVITKLQHRFPNQQLFTSMKILNPHEWPKNPQELIFFGNNNLEILLKYFERPNFHNNC
ncbi:21653_t:CDS:2 [Gigaspora rosea]|nr:21653_t:CDS:2 [Gigaspora rosea]